jgi:hypothetical protein
MAGGADLLPPQGLADRSAAPATRRNVWPKTRAAREQAEAEADDETRRIEDARRRASEL